MHTTVYFPVIWHIDINMDLLFAKRKLLQVRLELTTRTLGYPALSNCATGALVILINFDMYVYVYLGHRIQIPPPPPYIKMRFEWAIGYGPPCIMQILCSGRGTGQV
jgi:hypothetical protein